MDRSPAIAGPAKARSSTRASRNAPTTENLEHEIKALTAADIDKHWDGVREFNQQLATTLRSESDNAETCSNLSAELAQYIEKADRARDQINAKDRESLGLYKIMSSQVSPMESWEESRQRWPERAFQLLDNAVEHTGSELRKEQEEREESLVPETLEDIPIPVDAACSKEIEVDENSLGQISDSVLEELSTIRAKSRRAGTGEARVERTLKSRVRKPIRFKR